MSGATPNFNFTLPTEGFDTDVWGGMLNDNWTQLDALLVSIRDALRTPIGGLYFSVTDDDPATTLGYGTWEAYAQGRALVGVGQADDSYALEWTPEQKRGTSSHELTVGQMPAHDHGGNTGNEGSHVHNAGADLVTANANLTGDFAITRARRDGNPGQRDQIAGNATGIVSFTAKDKPTRIPVISDGGVSFENADEVSIDASHSHNVTGKTGQVDGSHTHSISSQGGGNAHQNLQPSIAVYIWRRTA